LLSLPKSDRDGASLQVTVKALRFDGFGANNLSRVSTYPRLEALQLRFAGSAAAPCHI
jgi:hypothetical protein